MRLPDRIEREIRAIEMEYAARPGQHAGTPRLWGLRYAIEDFMKANNLRWDSGESKADENQAN